VRTAERESSTQGEKKRSPGGNALQFGQRKDGRKKKERKTALGRWGASEAEWKRGRSGRGLSKEKKGASLTAETGRKRCAADLRRPFTTPPPGGKL